MYENNCTNWLFKEKLNKCAKAGDLYQGAIFQKSLDIAKRDCSDAEIFVLSAKNGLVPIDEQLCPYNETLNGKSVAHKRQWAQEVTKQMQTHGIDPMQDKFIIFAGKNYHQYLPIANKNCIFDGCKSIGAILQKLNKLLS